MSESGRFFPSKRYSSFHIENQKDFGNNLDLFNPQDVLPSSKDQWTFGYLCNRVNEISTSAVKKFFQHQLTCPPASWKMSEVCISAR